MATTLTPLQVNAVKTSTSAPAMGYANRYNATAGALAVTLPALSGQNVGARALVQKYTLDGSGNDVTFTRSGSDQFDDGTASFALTLPGESRTLQVVSISGVKRWKIMEAMEPPSSAPTSARLAFNVKDFGAVGDGSVDDTSSLNAAVTAAQSAGGGIVFIPAGTYKITSTLNWKINGLQVQGAGTTATKIVQFAPNVPIVQLAGKGQNIGGLWLTYNTQQLASATNAICLTFGDNTVGDCWESHYHDLLLELCQTGMAITATTTPGLFSCHLENIRINGYSKSAINLAAPSGACTGSVFTNIYTHNNYFGSVALADYWPVRIVGFDELIFNQLNIETTSTWYDFINITSCGTIVFNGLHFELDTLFADGGSMMVVQQSRVIINGGTAKRTTFSGSASNPVFKFTGTGAQVLAVNGWTDSTNTVTAPSRAILDFGTSTNSTAAIYGMQTAQTTALAVGADATNSFTINGRTKPRVVSVTSSATPAINVDATDVFKLTAQATAITSMTSGLTGTPLDGQRLVIRIKGDATPRAITWGSSFASSGACTLLATTAASKTHEVEVVYDAVAAKWYCVRVDATGY